MDIIFYSNRAAIPQPFFLEMAMNAFKKVTVNTWFSTHKVWVLNKSATKAAKKSAWRLIYRGKHPQTGHDGEPSYQDRLDACNRRGISLEAVKYRAADKVAQIRHERRIADRRSSDDRLAREILAGYAHYPRVARALESSASLHSGVLVTLCRLAEAGDAGHRLFLESAE